MLEKTTQFMRKHCFADEPHCGDYLSVCKACNQKAWLIDDIKHKKNCDVKTIFEEIQNARELGDERKTLANDERCCIRDKAVAQKRGKRTARSDCRSRSAERGE